MDHMNGTDWAELQAEQQAERDARDAARMRHDARRHTYAVLYLGREWRVEANLDAEYGAEWTLNEASLLADENATLTAQLTHYDSMRTRHTLLQIANDDLRGECASLKRELEALRAENATLCEKLDAANAKLAALENAALRNENDQMRKQLGIPTSADLVVRAGKRVYPLASQADAHEDDDDATPADAPDDDVTVALMDERARPPMKLTPPARKPDAAA